MVKCNIMVFCLTNVFHCNIAQIATLLLHIPSLVMGSTFWFAVVLYSVLVEGLFWIQGEQNLWDISSCNNHLFIRVYETLTLRRRPLGHIWSISLCNYMKLSNSLVSSQFWNFAPVSSLSSCSEFYKSHAHVRIIITFHWLL